MKSFALVTFIVVKKIPDRRDLKQGSILAHRFRAFQSATVGKEWLMGCHGTERIRKDIGGSEGEAAPVETFKPIPSDIRATFVKVPQ